MHRENFALFDALPARVRRRLTETTFEMSAADFAGMSEQTALGYINDIDRAVRAADRTEKSRFYHGRRRYL